MESTNNERVARALDLLKAGLGPIVSSEMESRINWRGVDAAQRQFRNNPELRKLPLREWDAAALLTLMWDRWHDVFGEFLGRDARNYVSELREHRKRWAHQERFSGEDAHRAIDTACRLLTTVGATQAADDVEKLRTEMRTLLPGQKRSERDKLDSLLLDNAAVSLEDTVGLMLGKETHAPGEVEDSVLHTLCGVRVYSHGPAEDGGHVAAPDRLDDVTCRVCRDNMQGIRLAGPGKKTVH